MTKSVTLWIPGLLHSQRIEEAGDTLKKTRLPWLMRLLSKADSLPQKSNANFYQSASYLFHQPYTLPIAATMVNTEISSADDSLFWLKLDPVQLIADRDSLILIPAKDLGITEEESLALIKAFNQHFSEEKVTLQYGSKNSWYLSLLQPVDIQSTLIDDLYYRPLNNAFPKGNAATYWKKLLNETQMLFFSHPINERRREESLPEINSVWAWGEGQQDRSTINTRKKATIYSNNLYLKGLADKTNAKYYAEPKKYQGGVDSSEHDLICLDSITNNLPNLSEQEWINCLIELDKLWFEPLYQDLKAGKINSLLLDLGMKSRHHLQPKHLNRFWRLTKNITKL